MPRALVNLNSRAVLTDPQGRFSFAGFTESNGYAQVTKPGYSATAGVDAARMQKIANLDTPVELKLYPDALLAGTVTGPDGLPLARIQVSLRRLTFDVTGARWLTTGTTQTDVHGDFRFDIPSGRYRVSTGFVQRSQERGEAVLPLSFPAESSSSTEALELGPGEQRQLSLRPRVGPALSIQIAVDGADLDRGLRLTATTPSGLTFQVPAQRQDTIYTAQLPAGNYLLRATTGDRETSLEGEARLVVSAHGPVQTTIHLTPEAIFPVESAFEIDPASTTTSVQTTPSVQQFNLTLHKIAGAGDGLDPDIRLTVQPGKAAEFRAAPGRYRLSGGVTDSWFVQSAACGATNLLTEDLVVAAAAAGSPIRIVSSNAFGRLKGTVAAGGQPSTGWVYLIPQQPSLIPYFEIYIQADGSFQWYGAPGRYLAVPSSQQVREDFRSETFLHRFATGGRDLQITAGADTIANLTLAAPGVAR